MKFWAFVLSALVVVWLNANLFEIYREFSTNKVLRETAVRLGERFASTPRESLLVISTAGGEQVAHHVADSAAFALIGSHIKRIDSLVNAQSFTMMRSNAPTGTPLPASIAALWDALRRNFFGWLGMTLLVGLGSPFWYDVLRTLVGVKERLRARSGGGSTEEPARVVQQAAVARAAAAIPSGSRLKKGGAYVLYSQVSHHSPLPDVGNEATIGKTISPAVKFIVAHDTGNPNGTANGNVQYYERSRNDISASAHLFVDDREIIECVPALTGPPEKAWHVLYGAPADNSLYGFVANDTAIGLEYCYGTKINPDEAYIRYVWVMAFTCEKFSLDPRKAIVGHFFLDPLRKTDPVTGLAQSRRTYEQLLRDVVAEFTACGGVLPGTPKLPQKGTLTVISKLNIRGNSPSTRSPLVRAVAVGTQLKYIARINDGEPVNGNPVWYKLEDGNYCWSGGVSA